MVILTNLYEEGKHTHTLLKPQLAAVSMRWSISNLPLEHHHSDNTISITPQGISQNSQMFRYFRMGPFYGEFHKCHNADKIRLPKEALLLSQHGLVTRCVLKPTWMGMELVTIPTSPWIFFSWRVSMTVFWSGLSTIRSLLFWLTRLATDTSGNTSSLIMTTLPSNVHSRTAMFRTTSHSLQSYLYSMMDIMWEKI